MSFLTRLSIKRNLKLDTEVIEDLLTFQQHSVIDPFTPAEFSFDLRFEFPKYFQDIEHAPRRGITRDPHTFTASSNTVFHGDLVLYAQQMIWYGRKGGSREITILANPGD